MHPAVWNMRSGGESVGRRWRVALYSHDTMGLGHMRRNLLIAQTLARPPLCAGVLLIAGAREASTFVMPPGVDCLTLPALRKVGNGHYQSRSLGVGIGEIIALRAGTIRAALEAFEPDVLIADNVPRGARGELDAALDYLRRETDARCVLGLRDVLDDPETVRSEWERAGNEEVIRDYYDAVWVYGDRAVNDLARAYRFSPGLSAKVSYTGYFDQRKRLEWSRQVGAVWPSAPSAAARTASHSPRPSPRPSCPRTSAASS
jgi:predicted glycosyltransferase